MPICVIWLSSEKSQREYDLLLLSGGYQLAIQVGYRCNWMAAKDCESDTHFLWILMISKPLSVLAAKRLTLQGISSSIHMHWGSSEVLVIYSLKSKLFVAKGLHSCLTPKLFMVCWRASKKFENLSIRSILNRLPLKFSLATTVFCHFEGPFDRKCSWKELGGALYTQKWILEIQFLPWPCIHPWPRD